MFVAKDDLSSEKRIEARSGRLGGLLVVTLLVVAAGAPWTAQAQTARDALRFSQRAPAVSEARSLGRGGAARAGIAGPTALFYNPAGLGWMESSAASGALAFIGTSDEARFRSNLQETSVDDYGGHAALAYKFPAQRGSLVFGGAYNQTNTFGRELGFRGMNSQSSITQTLLPTEREYFIEDGLPSFDADVPSSALPFAAYQAGAIEFYGGELDEGDYPFGPAVLEGTTVEQIGTVEEGGRQSEINFGAGVAAASGVMVGLSANVALGRYQFVHRLSELDNGDNDNYSVITGDETYRGLDEVRFEERFESNLSGVSLRGGLSAEAVPGVRLGLTLETPTFYTVNESYTQAEITTFFDDGNQLSYGGLEGDEGVGQIEYRVRTPWRLGAGGQANLLALTNGVADLTLSADVELVDWSQLSLDAEEIDFETQNQVAEEDFGAVLNTNIGAEYRMAGFALRAGFAHRPDPRDSSGSGVETSTAEAPDTDRQFYSLGAGYRFSERFEINAGWMQEHFEDTFRPYGGENAPRIAEEVTRNRFLVGVRYFF